MALPAGIIFVNNDLTVSVRNALVKQLYINDHMTGAEFDAIIAADPDYPAKVKQLNQRIMVIRSFEEDANRALADVVIFVAHATAAIEANNFGPPGLTYPVDSLTWGKLCVYKVDLT